VTRRRASDRTRGLRAFLDAENVAKPIPLLLVRRIVKHLPKSCLRLRFGVVLLVKHGCVDQLDKSPTQQGGSSHGPGTRAILRDSLAIAG
jgi:hypothetical protein